MMIALTGANGFVGRYIAGELLRGGYHVRALTRSRQPPRPGLQWVEGDLLKPEPPMLKRFVEGCSSVVHCAGEIQDEAVMEQLHQGGTSALLDASIGQVKRFVQLSSCGVYGTAEQGALAEDAPLRPIGTYEVTKCRAEQLVAERAQKGKFDAIILRPAVIYGTDMPNDSLRALLRAIDNGRFIYIGDKAGVWNGVHVQDVARAAIAFVEAPEPMAGAYNLSQSYGYDEIVEIVCRLRNRAHPRARLPRWAASVLAETLGRTGKFPLTPSRLHALTNQASYPSERIGHSIGFNFSVDLESGLRPLIEALPPRGQT